VLEGIFAATVGAILSVLAIVGLTEFVVADVLAASLPFTSLVGTAEALTVAPILLATGVILAILASGFSIRRYLKI
jgi:cell division transport system permease protein